ncbi:MAG: sigma-70 family RNA polymerase sigma factor [Rhodothermales bacterium]|nr:sigma-70 family RNA polymerase sigma factor [Rhodothermales bacterium]MBO6781590.1 sigma-70 family RNA polymerase sigma factor [Rhodothermales bacterium]
METPLHRQLDFPQIVRQYKRGVLALAYDLTGNAHDAEDLAQEVFIKAHRGLSTFRGDSGIYAWLRRIAVNTHLNRKRKKAVSHMRLFGDVSETDTWEGAERPPDSGAEATDTRSHIDRALEQLSPRERSAFVMRHYQELSTREVAEAMGVADGTVKSLLFRATTKLRSSLHYLRQES